jgi:hypothetical protein
MRPCESGILDDESRQRRTCPQQRGHVQIALRVAVLNLPDRVSHAQVPQESQEMITTRYHLAERRQAKTPEIVPKFFSFPKFKSLMRAKV